MKGKCREFLLHQLEINYLELGYGNENRNIGFAQFIE
jgi:hypothetical protein